MTIAGAVPRTVDIDLKSGWNFVGYPTLAERTVFDALSGIVYERIEGPIGGGRSGAPGLRIYDDGDLMKPGAGYWIKVPYDQIWVLTND